MTVYIGDELVPKIIRVSRGADRKFTLRRKNADGDPVDWDADVYLVIDIENLTTRVDAVVTGPDASIRLESTICDAVKDRTKWRAIMSQAGTPTLETALAVGVFQRQDGALPRV